LWKGGDRGRRKYIGQGRRLVADNHFAEKNCSGVILGFPRRSRSEKEEGTVERLQNLELKGKRGEAGGAFLARLETGING
jgi:hypothetical protein